MKWNVFYHNSNSDTICVYNIFDHAGFRKDAEEAIEKCKTKGDLSIVIKLSLAHYFWKKCEWEVVVTAWSGGEANTKIDIFDQVVNNWSAFIDYLWGFKEVGK